MSIEVSSNVVCKLGIGKMYKVFEKIKQYDANVLSAYIIRHTQNFPRLKYIYFVAYFEMEIGMIPSYVVYRP